MGGSPKEWVVLVGSSSKKYLTFDRRDLEGLPRGLITQHIITPQLRCPAVGLSQHPVCAGPLMTVSVGSHVSGLFGLARSSSTFACLQFANHCPSAL